MGRMLAAVVFCLCGALSAAAGERPTVSTVRFGPGEDDTRIVVEADAAPRYSVYLLAEQGDRAVLDLEPVDWALEGTDIGAGQRAGAGAGLVGQYRYAHNSPSTSRLVFDLDAPVRVKRHFVIEPSAAFPLYRLVVDLERTDRESFLAAAGFPRAGLAKSVAEEPEELVVVVDAGHGGKDPGAQGRRLRLREATVNLEIAKALKARLERDKRYRVVMTREDDRFIELEDRVKVAREAGADLFISIHADSAESGSAAGASVYTLSERAEHRSKDEILTKQNWLIDIDFEGRRPEVNSILVDLAQRETKNQSAAFADLLIPQLKTVGSVLRNTHRSAGYKVLLAPDVPAVLVEVGFLSNAGDEAALAQSGHRDKVAQALADAIDAYFDRRRRLYAAR